MYLEISFVYFDDCVVNQAAGRNVVQILEEVKKQGLLPLVYGVKIRVSKQDCDVLLDLLTTGLRQRKLDFINRKQVLVILYDHPYVEKEFSAVNKARNFFSFTKDLDGCSLKDQKICEEGNNDDYLFTRLDRVDGFNYVESNSTYIDNYIYLKALYGLGEFCDTVLLHIPHVINREMIIEIFEKIKRFYFNGSI